VDDRAICAGDGEPTNPCAAASCLTGTVCVERRGQAVCVPADSEPTNPCAAASCLTGTVCVDRGGEAVCVPADSEECE